jgi:hypothetical protein
MSAMRDVGINAKSIREVLPDEMAHGTDGPCCHLQCHPPLPMFDEEPCAGTFLFRLLNEWANVVAQKARCQYLLELEAPAVYEAGEPCSAGALMLAEIIEELAAVEIWLEDLHPVYQKFDYLTDGCFESIVIDELPVDWEEPRTVRVWQRLMGDVGAARSEAVA